MLPSSFGLFVLLVLLEGCLCTGGRHENRFRGHVSKTNQGEFKIGTAREDLYVEPTSDMIVPATGFWDQTYNSTGWSVLEIKTNGQLSNVEQVYSAGLLEGQLTRDLIALQWVNSINDVCAGDRAKFCTYLKEFLDIQFRFLYDQIYNHPDDEYWHQVQLLLIQLNGLIDGYTNTPKGPRIQIDDLLGFLLFQVVESTGDLGQVFGMLNSPRHDSCSALIKLLPNNTDVFVSHADWSNYKTMLKVIKKYTMPLTRSPGGVPIPGREMIFSSYPGTLHSVDDFYMMRPSNLTVIETTIENYNPDLWRQVIPLSVPEWIRASVANRLSNTGKDWANTFFYLNDGTYSNQWMIVDYTHFLPNNVPREGFLTVAEQMVTNFQVADMTEWLVNHTYWASYNNVYFPDFRTLSKEQEQVEKYGPELYSWQDSSRAKIFRRDQSNVTDLSSMLYMMRYNDYQHDPYSRCNCTPPFSAELTIAARCDLNPPAGKYPIDALGHRVHGATDAKITSYEMMQNFTLVAVAGPSAQNTPPFIWSKSDFNMTVPHFGQPDAWEFAPFYPQWMLS